ncbi:hypothetical protein LCGC14_1761450 [marine sediment metagenome]|uniref:Uncharacterized protein n=1 Tax=marine sediment metagenome TaxID=412755 RepID=A0A0F9HN96_9ZZZZ
MSTPKSVHLPATCPVCGTTGYEARNPCPLHAAAPELLAMLKRALATTQEVERVLGQRHFNPGTLQKMADAIAQAEPPA